MVFLYTHTNLEQIYEWLRDDGIDVEGLLGTGQMEIKFAPDAYAVLDGTVHFDDEKMLEYVDTLY